MASLKKELFRMHTVEEASTDNEEYSELLRKYNSLRVSNSSLLRIVRLPHLRHPLTRISPFSEPILIRITM